jgi:hypothetical protein
MRVSMLVAGMVVLLASGAASAQLDQLLRGLGVGQQGGGLTDAQVAAGLKDALKVGTENTVNITGHLDGYFKNQAIKILMPEKLHSLESGLRMAGFGPQVDEFVLSMNRAAEKAAPAAKQIFWDAIGQMTFEDARGILAGKETAATDYFRAKTSDRLATAFKPIVSDSMNQVGVTRQYKELVGRFQMLPFARAESFDLDKYVVGKSLDGLFYVLGQEEVKIRTNPTARVTDLLKEVFGK